MSSVPVFHVKDKHFSRQVDTVHDCVVLDKPDNVPISIGMDMFCGSRIRVDFTKCNIDTADPAKWTELCRFSYVPDDKSTCAAVTAMIRIEQVNKAEKILTMFADQLPGCLAWEQEMTIREPGNIRELLNSIQQASIRSVEAIKDLQNLDFFRDLTTGIVLGLVKEDYPVSVIREERMRQIPDFRRVVSQRFVADVDNILVDPQSRLVEPLQQLGRDFKWNIAAEFARQRARANLRQMKDLESKFTITPIRIATKAENFMLELFFYCLAAAYEQPVPGMQIV
jgi:hypothetical protein